MNIYFDVDYTILAMDGSLRPGTSEVFAKLTDDGHRVFVWSGIGVRTAEVREHDLERHVTGVFQKPLQDFEAGLPEFGVTQRPDFVIDDYPEIVRFFGGVRVPPYFFPNPDDDELERIYRIVTEYVLTGRCFDAAGTDLPMWRHSHNSWCAKAAGRELSELDGPDQG